MGRMGILITWSELTGTKPTKNLLHQRLANYALQAVLLGLAQLSAQLNTWLNRRNATGELEATRQTLPTYYAAIKQLTEASPDRVILTRITILYVAKQALVACQLTGNRVETNRTSNKS
jgi:hypothetical protein